MLTGHQYSFDEELFKFTRELADSKVQKCDI